MFCPRIHFKTIVHVFAVEKHITYKFDRDRAGSLILCLWVTTHVRKVMGSNLGAVYWMDIFSHCFVVKSVSIVCLKRSKINESGWGRPILNTNLIETYKWGYATCLFDYNF